MVSVKVVNKETDAPMEMEKDCDVAIVFTINGSEVNVTMSGAVTLELIKVLRKEMPKTFKKFLNVVEENYNKEALKIKAMEKVKETMQSEKE